MRNDTGGTGAVPSIGASEILRATRGIDAVTGVETEEWGTFPGPHMTVERMWALRNRIREHLARPEVMGVVVTHGTDTLEESAYLVARSLPPGKPVAFTGAMRTVSDLGWDGHVGQAGDHRAVADLGRRALVVAFDQLDPVRHAGPLPERQRLLGARRVHLQRDHAPGDLAAILTNLQEGDVLFIDSSHTTGTSASR